MLIADPRAGCSLAASITAADVRLLRERYPGVPVVTYVNTSAAVKAESDICCTSGNAKKVVESLGAPRVIMLPDEYLARNIAAQTKVEIIAWKGHCEVHERFTAADIRELRESHPGRHRAGPSGMPARGGRRMPTSPARPRRWPIMSASERARPRRAADRMLDERQRRGRASRLRVRAAVQSLPAHEADHLAEDPPCARNHDRTKSRSIRRSPSRARAAVERMLAVACDAAGREISSARGWSQRTTPSVGVPAPASDTANPAVRVNELAVRASGFAADRADDLLDRRVAFDHGHQAAVEDRAHAVARPPTARSRCRRRRRRSGGRSPGSAPAIRRLPGGRESRCRGRRNSPADGRG